MGDAPARPKNVPPKAVWIAEDGEWELGPRNPKGEKHGAFKYWRADGTLCNEVTLVNGVPKGPFKRFHNNGEVSQEGTFVDGQLHGTRTWHACDEPTDEKTLAEGMSRHVRRSEMDYDMGRVVAVRHFDAAGHRVLPNGDPYPERPPMVPDEAEYQPDAGWVLSTLDHEGRRNGTWQRWHDNGNPAEVTEYVHNVRHGPAALFHENGKKAEEGRFEQGHREGVWREWGEDGQLVREVTWQSGSRHGPLVDNSVAGEYANPAIAVERGFYQDGHACGAWSLLDSRGKTVIRRELGPALDEEKLAACRALADEGKTGDAWHLVAEECGEGKCPTEALLAEARAAATTGVVRPLLEALAERALPRSPQRALELAKQLPADAPLGTLVNQLLRGAAPGPVLRALAVRLDQEGRSRAALDFVNAAILLQPQEGRYLFTRSLVLMSLGLPAQAIEDARAREVQAGEEGRFLANYARVLFPTFDFWPGREKPETYYDGLPGKPAQQGGAVRAVVLKYVTRLMAIREAQLGWVKPGAEVPWLLPDLSRVLPAGPVKLDRLSIEREDEEGQPFDVQIDERVKLAGLGLPDLQRLARSDWTALTWLCWACGLKEIALPKTIAPPADFGQAAGMALQRLWRTRDKRITGGEVAQREEIPGFEWEGTPIDDLHPNLVSMPEAEYAEMAAMFRWLSDASNRSPWQDNLRGS